MKAVILAGGLGTRITEETSIRPKIMVEIGGTPIIWHIMKTYSHYGIRTGNPWTPCATSSISSRCGTNALLPGRSGKA